MGDTPWWRLQAPNRLVAMGTTLGILGGGNLALDGLVDPERWVVALHAAELAASIGLLGLGLRRYQRHGRTMVPRARRQWPPRRSMLGGPFDTDRD